MMPNTMGGRLRMMAIAAMLVGSAGRIFSQAPAQDKAPAAGAQSASSAAGQPTCAQIPDSDIPMANTLQAKVTNPIEASHLKPGKKLWVNAAMGMIYPGCRLDPDAAIYGTVTAASASKDPAASELSIDFNSADCTGHSKQSMKFVLIGVVAPPDQLRNSHSAMPTEVSGAGRQISDAAGAAPTQKMGNNPGGPSSTVKPGEVFGYKNLKLEPQGGPQCSGKLTSTEKNIQLSQGAVLLLAVPGGQ